MEVTAAVLFEGALAHYEVRVEDKGECYAQLSEYKGGSNHRPPDHIRLIKQGRHWVSENADPSLSDELGYAVELKLKPVLESRIRRGGHPAG